MPYCSDGVISEVWLILQVQGCKLARTHKAPEQLPITELPDICNEKGIVPHY